MVAVNVVAQVFAGLAAFVHVLVFVWEALLFRRPSVHRGIFRVPGEDVPAVLLWSFGVGFYNLFLASGTVLGLVLLNTGDEAVGRALVFYTCGFMALSGVVLFAADRMALGRPRGAGLSGVAGQLGPPLVVFATAFL
ncbi:DUF1304 family protein [Prauserella sp. PE36]|uniref:DUF1304 family protein n=1 Tax=Prauserella sp. PE36 TaxID=1504709 RepID=UPI001F3D15FA|nr:DUF1304 domain-containing protein [Prauserella sp. PE36]